MISTELTVLSSRLYVQTQDNRYAKKRQVVSISYSVLAPVVLTVNIINNMISIESITQVIRSVDNSVNSSEIIGFNPVGMYICTYISFIEDISQYVDVCECISNSEDIRQTSVVDICIGPPTSPCICDTSSCKVCMYCVSIKTLLM